MENSWLRIKWGWWHPGYSHGWQLILASSRNDQYRFARNDEATENDDARSSPNNDIASNDEAAESPINSDDNDCPNDIVVASTSGQAKNKWIDLKMFHDEEC